MTPIKIFLASSNDLQEERNAIELMVSRENEKIESTGVKFKVVRWEQLLQAFQPKRVQDFFNKEMLECQVMIALFYNRLGKFTLEEFQTAVNSFKQGKNPRYIVVFFKPVRVSIDEIDDQILKIKALKQNIEQHEQIYCTYENLDELKNKLKEQMDLLVETYKNETSSPQATPVQNIVSEKTRTANEPFYRNWLLWLFAIIFVSMLSGFWIYHSTPYNFTIPNSFLRSDGVVVIHSENWKANQNQYLNVEFDGFKFTKSGKPTEKDALGNQVWHFRISAYHPPKKYLKDGEHQIRMGFPGKKYCDEVYKICFITKDLIVDAMLSSKNKNSKIKILKGRAATESQLEENTISVDVIFFHEGPTTAQDVPVKFVNDPNAKLVYYEFETAFDGFPEISEDDPRYDQPFFNLKITDKAGNEYVQEHSYAQFVAAGALRIAAGNANIRLNKFHPEGSEKLATSITYTPKDQSTDSEKLPHLRLKVRSIVKDIRTLEWESENIQQVTPQTLIYRDDKLLATTTKNKYTDTEKLDSDTVSYKVVQEDSSGARYTSNVEKVDVIKEKTFMLTVRSNVRNDIVFIDNKEYGPTRLDVALPEGQHEIQVIKEGYFPFEKKIDLKNNMTVRAQMKQKPGSIEIVTIPEGAAVYVNQDKKGLSPLNIQTIRPGDVKIKAVLMGYAEQTKKIKLKPEQHETVTFNLTILPGSLFVKIVPEDAAISFIDHNKTYSKGMALDPGQYKIQGKKKGYESQTKEISITAGKKSEISINLTPTAPTTKTWTDPTTNMVFVWIPEGCFQMGSPTSEKDRGSDEGPVHKVCVDGFWLGKYEVTRGQFRKFITATQYKTDAEKEGSSYGYKDGNWKNVEGYNWKNSGFEQNDSHPVISVSWNDAKEMAKWMSKNSKYTFKLPTEAEWEYACRAGTQTSRFWGDDPDQACKYANVADKFAKKQFSGWTIHNCTDGYVFTAPVGKFLDNPFQLSDMLGNVWEWCEDAYSSDAYKKHGSKSPVIRSGANRVIRGGSWFDDPGDLRSAVRDYSSPGNRGNRIGFRLLRTR
jgi:formylglycine-generating enzyme required for sulfatase activity/translation elongation factor P/translation initiation factor 5A